MIPALPGGGAKRYLKRIKGLQDDLGHANDVAECQTLAFSLGEGAEPSLRVGAALVLGWHLRGLQGLEPGLRADWETFCAASPPWPKPALALP